MRKSKFTGLTVLCLFCFVACETNDAANEKLMVLFNGKNLDGWIVKIRNYPAGENFGNTFRVEDGILKVRYDAYETFDDRFGHIYTDTDYSHYKLTVEYRFTGDQVPGAPEWAWRNSGAMLHAQAPEDLHQDQDFPASIEAQMLGGDGENERPTGNVCSPGTDIFINGAKVDDHCVNSTSKTYHGDQWVVMEMIVHADSAVHHIVNGDTVMTYTNITVDGKGLTPEAKVVPGPLKSGRIALQSEGHPVDFKRVELIDLSPKKK